MERSACVSAPGVMSAWAPRLDYIMSAALFASGEFLKNGPGATRNESQDLGR